VGLLANTVIAVAFLAVAVLLGKNLARAGQWRRNPLGVATFWLYVTCGGGHAVHALLLTEGVLAGTAVGAAAMQEYADWHPWFIDVVTAFAGIGYWTMRRRFPDLVSGAAVFEDLRERRRRALEIHDNVVQGLARAKLALDSEHEAEGEQAVRDALTSSKRIITELLGQAELPAGSLRRASNVPPGRPPEGP
jgi:signal transduction histidine kinase